MTALVHILGRRTVTVKLPTFWYGAFLLFSLLSVLWAQYSEDLTLRYMSKMLQILTVCFCITLHIRKKKDMESFLSVFIAACVITVVSIFVRVPPSEWLEGFLGRGVTGNNINVVAYTCVAGLCLSFYKAYYLKLRSYYLPAVLMAVYIVLSSSRKALVMAAVMIFGMALFFIKKKSYVFKLFVLAGSKSVQEPTEVLSNAKTQEFLATAREEFDYVIIDTPPVGLVADAAICANYSDSAIFVIREDTLVIPRIADAVNDLTQSGTNLAGCVYNNTAGLGRTGYGRYSRSGGKYDYGSYGKYGYGYGGYEDLYKSEKSNRRRSN